MDNDYFISIFNSIVEYLQEVIECYHFNRFSVILQIQRFMIYQNQLIGYVC